MREEKQKTRILLTLHSSHPNKNLPFNRKKDLAGLNG
jgi:hypothetical protein